MELGNLKKGNNADHEYEKDKVIHQLFEESVLKTPDRIAVTYRDHQISYKLLNQKANQLAHFLIKQGVNLETMIAISVPRGLEMIIGLLAILKSGGTYVPIDSEYPIERIFYILKDIKASIFLTTENIRGKLSLDDNKESNYDDVINKLETICLEEDLITETLKSEEDTNPNIEVQADNLCYVIYTSGSTGKPKGVGICHVSLVNRINYLVKTHPVTQDWIIFNKIPFCFDPCLREIFLSLTTGAKLSIISSEKNKNTEELAKYCFREKPNLLVFTPSHLQVFIDSLGTRQENLEFLKMIYICGEYLKSSLLNEAIKIFPNAIFKNQYGPTEGCQFSFEYSYFRNKSQSHNIPVGNSVDDIYEYILDEELNQVPVGVIGEIYIGGTGLARGYIGKPVLTAEKFIANPYINDKKDNIGSRLYKTGDLGKYLSDGNIEFINRIDNQVKIRGFRVELGEIENILLKSDRVKQAVVLAREDVIDQKRLIGYIVLTEQTSKESGLEQEIIDSLRELIAHHLPEYMQLSQIVILDRFPLTPNGKLDRKALVIPEERAGISLYQAPEGLLEEKLATIWQDVLKIKKVGRNDNFFHLGGHSLNVLLMIAKLRSQESIEVPIDSIFKYPILRELAKSLDSKYSFQRVLPPIKRVNRGHFIPLSFAQQRLWFIYNLMTRSGLYHISRAIRLNGELDTIALRKALNHMVRRHEVLRTLIINKEGLGGQLILNEDTPFNLTELSFSTKEALDTYLAKEVKVPFDFEKIPLCRGSLVRFNGNYILLTIFHHIISDGWSIDIWNRELSSLYLSYRLGIEPVLPHLPVQYADFSIWQRKWLSGNILDKQLNYWQKQLDGVSTLELPIDYQRPKQQSYEGNSYRFYLSKKIANDLNDISRNNGTTLFMTLLSVFQAMLSRYSNQSDIVVGTPIAGRRMQETECLIGFFVNTLVLRINTENNPTFRKFLLQVKEVVLEAYSNQDVPFEQVVEYLNVPRDLGRHPIFQVMFILQNNNEEIKFGDIKTQELEINDTQSKFDLTLNVRETNEGLDLKFEYASDLFKQETIKRLCGYYENFINEIIHDPDKRLSDICILDAQELKKLKIWNETNYEYEKDKTIHRLFEESVLKTPDRIAIIYKEQQISYKVLNQKANQLANFLIKQGVNLETKVAISLPRSPEMIIGLLAILKSGGAYVPIDSEYPLERIYYMLKDSGASILLTSKDIKYKLGLNNIYASNIILPDGYSYLKKINIINLDEESLKQNLKSEKDINPNIEEIQADNLCYIIYTSGSTGKPKGVEVNHSGVSNLAEAQIDIFGIKEKTRVIQFASLSFDAHVSEIFVTIIRGASLCLVDKEILIDRELFIKFINKKKINLATFSSSFLNNLNSRDAMNIETIVSAGEGLPTYLLEKWCKNKFLINAYGPTESTVCISSFLYTKKINTPNIVGRPIYNSQIYVLDKELNQVPIGATGEIYIGGIGIARGYTGKPGLTAEKFIANPYTDKNNIGSRLYKTGDLGRYLQNGDLEFMGRIDHQVKIRGFRIELGEIESILLQYKQIKQAVVLAREDVLDQKKLIGYVVLKEGINKNSGQEIIRNLRELTAKSLPDYMQLSQIIILDVFPLTQSGKLDRKALISPRERDGISLYQAPKGLLEQKLAIIWQDILKIEKVGRNDNFFHLGGHSLNVLLMISKLRSQESIEVPIDIIFRYPILQEFARNIENKSCLLQDILPPIKKVSRDQLIPLSFAQQRLWFIDQLVTNKGLYHISRTIRLSGELDVLSLKKALNHIVRRHEILRTLVVNKEGVGTQLILNKDTLFNLVELRLDTKDELDNYLTQEIARPFDFEQEPLCRGVLIKFDKDYILLIIFHHIISDDWSESIWNKELSSLYFSYKQGIEPNLLPLTVQYADFSIWQRKWLSGNILDKQLNYWQKQLEGISTLELPIDYFRPKQQSYKGSSYRFYLNQETLNSLNDISKDNGTTLFITMLAIFQVMLGKYSNQKDILVGTPIAGRRVQETEGLIGFFINALVLRAKIGYNLTFKEFLLRVKATVLEAYSNQDIPFEQLVEYFNVPRDLSRHPIFQVMFVLQNNEREELRLDGIKVTEIEIEINNLKAKFDLTLNITETGEGLNLKFEYASDLFKSETIERLCNYYTNLINEVIQNPNKKLADICILGEVELGNLKKGNNTDHEYEKDKVIHQLFEESVLKTPDRIAVTYRDHQISYKLLNQKANQLAHFLIKQGVNLETMIAISVPRGLEMIIGLLAILKSGGTYVPIDSEYPIERIFYILKDSKASIFLTTENIREKLSLDDNKESNYDDVINKLEIICLEEDLITETLKSEEDTNPNIEVQADNLCYVIYTSGSTGKPKGINCIHRGMVNRLFYPNLHVSVPDNAIGCLQSNFAFIDAAWDIFSILTSSSRLVLYKELISKNINEALKVWIMQGVERVTVTPSIVSVLIDQMKNDAQFIQDKGTAYLKVKNLKVTGEYFDISLSEGLFKISPVIIDLFDCYGSTEATSVIYRNFNKDKPTTYSTDILSNTQIYILDEELNQVPVGVIGEIYIGGTGLARGYIGNPGLTAEKFIANPYINDKKDNIGSRLYKTGDLGKYLPDGNIEFINRIDNQVKIRGFRVELGEIENILLKSDRIKQAVVLAREDVIDQKRLIGYIVLTEQASKESDLEQEIIDSLRELIAHHLPEYMQLSQIVILDRFPLTPNGKLDRKALVIPEERAGISLYQAPEGLLEEKLATIWQDVLKIKKVGRNDNFFHLGGHSLNVLLMIAKLRSQESIEVPIDSIFKYPILRELAKNLEQFFKYSNLLIKRKKENEIIQITENMGKVDSSPLYLVHEGLGIIHPYFNLKNIVTNPVYAIEDPYIGKKNSGFVNINEMVSYYVDLISNHHQKYFSHKSINIGGWSFGAIVAYEIAITLSKKIQIDNLIIIDRHAKNEKDRLKNLILNKNKHNILDVSRNYKLLSEYERTHNYNSQLTLIKAKVDSHMSVTTDTNLSKNYYGWSKFVPQILLYEAEGNHYSLFSKDNVVSIGKILNNILKT